MTERAAFPSSPFIQRSDARRDVDVVVIGAGAAGIGAAREALARGASVRVLEARGRLGGRAFTDQCGGVPFDAGAAYVHYADRNPWVGLAAELGIALEPHRGWGRGVPFRGGVRLPEQDRQERMRASERFWQLLYGSEGRDLSLADLVRGEADTVGEAARRYGEQAIGEDPERIGVADLRQLWEGPDKTVPGGYGALVAAAGAGLPIALNAAVRRVHWGSHDVVVEGPAGSIRAGAAIITAPLGVLASGSIRFDPPLPPATAGAIGALRMGALTKVVLAFDGERFGWPSPSDLYPLGTGFNLEFWPFNRDIVIATIGGTPARDLVRLGEEGAAAALLDVVADIVGSEARRHVTAGRIADWVSDPCSRGAYSYAPPGAAGARAMLAEPIGGRLFFAGEATSGGADTVGGAMTVGGALIAGQIAARQACARLRVGEQASSV